MMAKYRSLLYREWKLTRKYYISSFLVLILFMALCWLVRLSMKIGNLSSVVQGEDGALINTMTYYIFIYFVAFAAPCIASADNGVFRSDINAGWLHYSFALPITALDRTIVRFLMSAGCYLLSFLLSVLNAAVVCAMAEKPFSGGMLLNFLIPLDMCLVLDVIRQAITLHARDAQSLKKRNGAAMCVTTVLGMGVCVLLMWKVRDWAQQLLPAAEGTAADEIVGSDVDLDALLGGMAEQITQLRDALAPWLIPAMLLLFALGFFLTWNAFQRRENA